MNTTPGILRGLSRSLVRYAAHLLRSRRADWAVAMENELEHIDGDGRALLWALGCLWTAYRERYLGDVGHSAMLLAKYGLIQGVLSFSIFVALYLTHMGGMTWRWVEPAAITSPLIVLMVSAHWDFKKAHNGAITYLQAVGSGVLFSGIGAMVNSALMYIYLRYINPAFLPNALHIARAHLEQQRQGTDLQWALGLASSLLTPIGYAVQLLIIGMLAGLIVALLVSIFTHKLDGGTSQHMEARRSAGILLVTTRYGLIQGMLSFVIFLLGHKSAGVGVWPGQDLLLLIALMAVAHWEFRKRHNGAMSYSQGLGSGALISTVGSVISCVLLFVYLKYINTGFLAAVMEGQRASIERRGITGTRAQHLVQLYAAGTRPAIYAVSFLVMLTIAGFVLALVVAIFTRTGDRRLEPPRLHGEGRTAHAP
jgi:hypothetical protein